MKNNRPPDPQMEDFFELSLDPMCIADATGRFVRVNTEFQRMLGFTKEELTSCSCSEFIHPEDREETLAMTGRLRRGEVLAGFENRHRCKDGSWKRIFWRASPSADRKWIYAVARDLTGEWTRREEARKREQRQLRYQEALLRLRDDDYHSLDGFLKLLTEECSEALEAPRVSIWFFADKGEAIECRDLYLRERRRHESGLKLLRADAPGYFEAISRFDALVVRDARNDAATREFRESYLDPNGITSMLDVPLRSGSRFSGVMCCEHTDELHVWDALEEKFATGVAAYLMTALERDSRREREAEVRELNATLEKRVAARTAELAASERQFRALFSTQFSFIGLLSPEGILLEINDTALRAGNLVRDDVVGKPLWATHWWDVGAAEQARLREAISRAAKGEFIRYEFTARAVGDSRIIVDFTLTPFADESGRVTLLIPEGRDVTQDKAMQAALRESEERFRLMVEGVQDYAIFALDPQGHVTTWNAGARRAKGWMPNEIIGKHFSCFYTEEDRKAGKPAALLRIAETEGRVADEGWRVRKDGARFWAYVVISAVRDASGTLKEFAKVTHDLTTQRRAESELRSSEEQFRAAMENSAIGMALVSPEGKWLRVNRSLCEILGYPAGELLELDFQTITHPEDLNADLDQVRRVLAGEIATYQMEKRYHHKDGGIVWALLNVSLVRDASGTPRYFISQIQDISERRKADEALRLALDRQRELTRRAQAGERAKSEFLAVMSHEVRTPMNGILGFAELLSQIPELPPVAQDYAQTIVQSGTALLRILDDVLDLSRLEAGALEIKNLPFCPAELLRDIRTLLTPAAGGREIELRLDIGPTADGVFFGDPGRLRQILLNLCGNAIKFTEQGSVVLSVCRSGEIFEFSVRDTGCGIKTGELERLFEPFVQGDSSHSRRYGGVGLGLSISRRLARLMGGELTATSQPGMGSEFAVKVPLWPAQTETPDPPALARSVLLDEAFAQRHPLSILVVENDAVNLRLILTMLKKLGYEPLFGNDGMEAVEICQRENPRCVLMDVQMPRMDGIRAAAAIREREAADGGGAAYICALTADTLASDRDRCLAAGMNDFLNKPLRTDRLMRMLEEASERTAARA